MKLFLSLVLASAALTFSSSAHAYLEFCKDGKPSDSAVMRRNARCPGGWSASITMNNANRGEYCVVLTRESQPIGGEGLHNVCVQPSGALRILSYNPNNFR